MDYDITKAEAKQNKLNREFNLSQQEANLIKEKIKQTTNALENERKKQVEIRNEIKAQTAEAAKLDRQIEKIKSGNATILEVANFGSINEAETKLREMESNIKSNEKLYEKSVNTNKRLSAELSRQQFALDKQNAKTQNIGDNIKSLSNKSEQHARSWGKTDKNLRRSQSSMARFGRRVTELIKSALIFSVLTKAFTALRNSFGKFLTKEGTQTAALISKIKGNLATIGQTLYQSAKPHIEWLLQKLVDLTKILAVGLAKVLGQDVNKMAEMAEQAQNTADSAEKATASFDTLQKINTTPASASDNTIETDTSAITSDTNLQVNKFIEKMKEAIPLISAIAVGLAGWKITNLLSQLGVLSGKQSSGLLISILGLVVAIYGVLDAWVNGIDWGNFITIIGGLTLVVAGLWVAFGWVAGAIGLIVGGVLLVALGISDMVKNGVNGLNLLTVFVGGVSTAFGILLLKTGSVKKALTALFSPTGVLIMGVTLLAAGIGYLAANWDKLSPAQRTITILGALAAALVAAAVAVALFHTSWSVGIAAGTIAAGIALLAGTYLFKKANQSGVNTNLSSSGSAPSSISQYAAYATMNNPIPALATGAVIPGGSPFLAVLGDQRKGQTNIEAPLDTIVEAFKAAQGTPHFTIEATGSLSQLIRMLRLQIKQEDARASIF